MAPETQVASGLILLLLRYETEERSQHSICMRKVGHKLSAGLSIKATRLTP